MSCELLVQKLSWDHLGHSGTLIFLWFHVFHMLYPLVMADIAIKKAIEIVDFPMKNGGSFHSYVSLPEGNH